jgi:hypothetical protein
MGVWGMMWYFDNDRVFSLLISSIIISATTNLSTNQFVFDFQLYAVWFLGRLVHCLFQSEFMVIIS